MTSFCHQLKLLLWKNYILRKRHKVRLVLELVWPLILFLVLMWIRRRGSLIPMPVCHLIEKALPSVGGFPFLQNFICSLSNNCSDSYVEDNHGKDQWARGILPKLVKEGAPILYDLVGTDQGVSSFSQFLTLVNRTVEVVRRRMSRLEGTDLKKLGTVPLFSLLTKNAEEDWTFRWLFTWRTADELLSTQVNLSEFSKDSYDKFMSLFDGADEAMRDRDIWRCIDKSKEEYDKLVIISDWLWLYYCESGPLRSNFRMDLLSFFRDFVDKTTDLYEELVRVYNNQPKDDGRAQFVESMKELMADVPGTNSGQTIANLQKLSLLSIGFTGDFAGESGQEASGGESERSLSSLFQSFCGLEYTNMLAVGVDGTNAYDSLRDHLRNWRQSRRYQYDSELSPRCNRLLEELESEAATSVLWRQMKPFIRGRLLYYPRTEFTESLMSKVDDKFSALQELGQQLNEGVRILQRLQLWLDAEKGNIEVLKSAFRGDFLRNMNVPASEFSQDWFASLWIGELGKVSTLLDSMDMNFAQELLKLINSDSKIVSAVVNCTRYRKSTYQRSDRSRNAFRNNAFRSEDDAVEEGMRLMLDNNLWAVIIFMDLPQDRSPPSHLKYKIRMDSDKVDGTRTTRDRITRRLPRRRPTLDLKYHTNGFLYLQELIEQSFIESTTTVEMSNMAFVLQQFPFPCYNFDQYAYVPPTFILPQ